MLGHQAIAADEKRAADRIETKLKAAIFLADDRCEIPCDIDNLSVGGAMVRCEGKFALDSELVLYIQGFGRFEAVVERFEKDGFGVSFKCGTLKRQRLAEQILSFVKNGGITRTHLRRQERTPACALEGLTLENGAPLDGSILDVSLLGVSIKTDQRPPIGSVVHVGRTQGRVVRHYNDGIGVQFSPLN